MSLPKAYEPEKYESGIYQLWEDSHLFKADPNSRKPHYSIVMPPPNETGTLHIGQALGITLQDTMIRHARQKGYDALWLPGTDHAAIATNALVEKQLTEEGTDRHQLGREVFIERVKVFVGNSRETIISQTRAMGASCDWSRLRYTLDEALNRCVNEVFVKMYHDGLIYRGDRIINWDPVLQTSISDDELVHKEEQAPLYTLQFGPFQITTARPETKFGDKYVVMHPDDKRYDQFKPGQTIELEWINGPITATVIKDEAVDPEFGTGVMTITPWHDHTDFEIAERNGLEKDQIIDFKGKLLPIAGEFAGLTIDEARPKIIKKLDKKGLLVKTDDKYRHFIAYSDRGKAVVEPQIKLQWFVDVNRPAVDWKGQKRSLKEVMRAVVEDGDIEIIPKRFNKIYFHWIDNLHDWTISRQIWWGHQVPVWYKGDETYCGTQTPKGEGWQQDPDTLDTWFSSALWTWSTLVDHELAKDYSLSLEDLLKQSQDFQTYHPTRVMETGWDIIFFWVARMILATTYATGQVPFKTVYLHGLVRTEAGKKMSKSDPETNINPVEVGQQYGTDALRLALISGVTAGNDMRLGQGRIADNRNFANKLWNIARYAEELIDKRVYEPEPESLADHWILNKLSICQASVSKDLDNYLFSEAYENLYHFVWDDLADWYIEASKSAPNHSVLSYVLSSTLIMLHPMAPFVTEAIWQNLFHGSLLAAQSWPEHFKPDNDKAPQFNQLKALIEEVRRISALAGLSKPRLVHQNDSLIAENAELIKRLGRLGEIKTEAHPEGLRLTASEAAWLAIDKQTIQEYLAKLKDQLAAAETAVELLKKRLSNKSYVENAPVELVEETKQQMAEAQAKQKLLATEISKYSA